MDALLHMRNKPNMAHIALRSKKIDWWGPKSMRKTSIPPQLWTLIIIIIVKWIPKLAVCNVCILHNKLLQNKTCRKRARGANHKADAGFGICPISSSSLSRLLISFQLFLDSTRLKCPSPRESVVR